LRTFITLSARNLRRRTRVYRDFQTGTMLEPEGGEECECIPDYLWKTAFYAELGVDRVASALARWL
jgi:hypothetical protein